LLLDYSLCQDFLKDCQPDYIRFSVDAGEKTKYEKIRRGGNFDVLVENIKDAVSLRNKLSKKTSIGIGSTLASHNLDQIEPLIILAKHLKVDSLGFWGLNPHGVGIATLQNTLRTSQSNVNFTDLVTNKVRRYSEKHNLKIPVDICVGNYSFTRCNLPYIYTFVQSNGEVFPCTDKLDYPLGNVYKQNFNDIWNGSKMVEFRKNYLNGVYPECNLCIFQKRKKQD
jgi:radical SAM protein with 4Fe4S-binding SPASM domain